MDPLEAFMVVGWSWIALWCIGAVIWLLAAVDEIDRR